MTCTIISPYVMAVDGPEPVRPRHWAVYHFVRFPSNCGRVPCVVIQYLSYRSHMRDLPKIKLNLKAPEQFGNVAEKLDPDARRTLATDLIELIQIDETSMGPWAGKAQGYLDKIDDDEADTAPIDAEQEGSGEEPPPKSEMTLSSVIQFSARATDALLGEPDLARASEPGEDNEKLAAWVSSQLRTKDQNWALDTDPLVVHMAATGLAWRMRDFDDVDKVFHSRFLPSVGKFAVIINDSVRSIERAPRVTWPFERYPYEIERSIQRKKWIDYDPRFDESDPQAPKEFYETDLWLDLDGDFIDEPWTITVSRDDTPEVIRIRPRWSKKTIVVTDDELFFNAIRRFYPYRFLPDPKGGFFPMGFGKLLDRTEDAADRLLGSIVDTAKTESENGGVMGGSQFGIPGKVEVKNNRITTIPTDGQPLANLLQMWPTKSVSSGSVAVLEKIMTLGDRLAGTLNLLENAPASMTATMAKGIIDTGAQVQSAVHRRMVASLTQEIHMFVQMADAYDMLPEGMTAAGKDGVAVTADPALATEMQRSALGSMYLQLLEMPMAFNTQEVATRFCQVMRLPSPEKLVAAPQQPQPTPDEKLKGIIGMGKLKTEQMKVKALVAVQITQALKNMVDAAGGMLDNQAALLQMAQLEKAVQDLMTGADDANGVLGGMAPQPGNPSPDNVPPAPAGAGGGGVPPGLPSPAGSPGDGGGGV